MIKISAYADSKYQLSFLQNIASVHILHINIRCELLKNQVMLDENFYSRRKNL